jgi:membrane-associated phospholipid phosphatase
VVPEGRLAVSSRVRTVDLVVAGYNLVLAAAWLGLTDVADGALWMAGVHALAAAVPAILTRCTAEAGAGWRVVRELYPLAAIALFWTELGHLHGLAQSPHYDAIVARLDLALFGGHLNLVWMPAMPWPAFSELMHLFYIAYYPLIILPPVAMCLAGRGEALRDMTLRLTVTYLGCYMLYLLFPVIGPAELLPHYEGALTSGALYRLTHAARAAGDSLGTAFPSSHTAGAVTAAVLGWRWLSRPARWLLTLQAGGVLLATVYTQNHYAVDALAGLVWALGLQLGLVPALTGETSAPVPPLPVRWSVRGPEPITGSAG